MAFLSLLMQAIPCVLHMDLHVGLKILTTLCWNGHLVHVYIYTSSVHVKYPQSTIVEACNSVIIDGRHCTQTLKTSLCLFAVSKSSKPKLVTSHTTRRTSFKSHVTICWLPLSSRQTTQVTLSEPATKKAAWRSGLLIFHMKTLPLDVPPIKVSSAHLAAQRTLPNALFVLNYFSKLTKQKHNLSADKPPQLGGPSLNRKSIIWTWSLLRGEQSPVALLTCQCWRS